MNWKIWFGSALLVTPLVAFLVLFAMQQGAQRALVALAVVLAVLGAVVAGARLVIAGLVEALERKRGSKT